MFEKCWGIHREKDLARRESFYTYPPMKMDQTECSETSAYKIQTPGNYPEENTHKTNIIKLFRSNHIPIPFIQAQHTYSKLNGIKKSVKHPNLKSEADDSPIF